MVMAQRAARLCARAAAGAAVAAPLVWTAKNELASCDPPRDRFGKLRSSYGASFVQLLNGAAKRQYGMGDHVFRTHDVADDADAKFYWILSGAVEVVKPSALEGEGEVSSSLKSGHFVGDLAFIPREKKRVRDVSAIEEAVIFEMRKDDFDAAMVDINPKLATRSGDTLEARLFAFVEMVSPSTRLRLKASEKLHRAHLTAGDAALYIVKEGSLRVTKKGGMLSSDESHVIEAGGGIHLEAMLKGSSRSIVVECATPKTTELAVVNTADFHTLLDRSQMAKNWFAGAQR